MKNNEKVLLTKRDRELMLWMNRMGFLTIEMIADKWKVAVITAYKRMQKLVSEGYISNDFIMVALVFMR